MSNRQIPRLRYERAVVSALEHNPVCALFGPRQCGKTTLARELAARRRNVHFFDLETAAGRARLAEPELTLASLEGLIIVEEVQRRPTLFEAIRPLADRPKTPSRGESRNRSPEGWGSWISAGSTFPKLVQGSGAAFGFGVGSPVRILPLATRSA